MLPEARRAAILRRLGERGEVRVSELARELGVSTVTIHRDLCELERSQQLRRTRGGAIALAALSLQDVDERCVVCWRLVSDRFAVRLGGGPGSPVACCAHCALLRSGGPGGAFARDTLSGRTILLGDAWFVLGSLAPSCCVPSVLVFADEDTARRFAQAFEGTYGQLEAAVHWLRRHCSHERQWGSTDA